MSLPRLFPVSWLHIGASVLHAISRLKLLLLAANTIYEQLFGWLVITDFEHYCLGFSFFGL